MKMRTEPFPLDGGRAGDEGEGAALTGQAGKAPPTSEAHPPGTTHNPDPSTIEGEGRSARVKTAVLISGSGSNMAALIASARDPDCPAEIVLVVSNRLDAPGLEKARLAGVPIAGIDHRPFGNDRGRHERLIHALLVQANVELVALAGYMRVLTPDFVGRWSGRMINIHPSLLPALPGLHTHRRALESGASEHGCSVHWVVDGVDEGPVIAQARVQVLPGDTETVLAARVLAEEHRLYPEALATAARAVASRR